MWTADNGLCWEKGKRTTYAQRLRSFTFFVSMCFCFSPGIWAQTTDSSAADSPKSWTATTNSKADYGNPTRTLESHTQNGDHTVDVRSVQTRGPDGTFTPYQDIETETVRTNATTTQTITRTFVRDGNGAKALFQTTEEARQDLPGGDSKIIRTTSNPDANGKLQVVQREVQETHKISSDAEETKTTVMLSNINGGLVPVMQTQGHQKHSGNTVEIQKTTRLADGAGGWQVGETREETIKDDGRNRSREERVSRPSPDGKLEEISRTVTKESEDVSGDRRNSVETYSIDVPGLGRDSSLRLVERVMTTQRSNSDGQQTTQLVEKSNPGDPDAGPRIATVTSDTVRSGPSGAQAIRTVQMRDANGSLGVISVDMTKSNSAQAVEVKMGASSPK